MISDPRKGNVQMAIKLNGNYVKNFISESEIKAYQPMVDVADKILRTRSGAGGEMTDWVELPVNYDKEEYARILECAKEIKENCDVFIVIGIGGSYLGARAVIELMKSQMYNDIPGNSPKIYFSGCDISAEHMNALLAVCEGKDVCINVISKSGTTTEPAIAFRIFRELLEKKYGKEGSKKRIFVTTDAKKGTLKSFADKEGYRTFVVPDGIGGRYSVMSAVGLLPIAVAGIDTDAMFEGLLAARNELSDTDVMNNDCYRYAVMRNILFRKGKTTEIMVGWEPAQQMFSEWWKQLYGESEGKNNTGIYPSSVTFSTDLHSLGQYIQQGRRNLFETVLSIDNTGSECVIPFDAENTDGMNFIAGKDMNFVNKKAIMATLLAHVDGGVPNILLEMTDKSAFSVGYLIYFFELACAISGYMLGVNPFDQPGVEAYKKNMFALLGKPGYEAEKEKLEKSLGI